MRLDGWENGTVIAFQRAHLGLVSDALLVGSVPTRQIIIRKVGGRRAGATMVGGGGSGFVDYDYADDGTSVSIHIGCISSEQPDHSTRGTMPSIDSTRLNWVEVEGLLFRSHIGIYLRGRIRVPISDRARYINPNPRSLGG